MAAENGRVVKEVYVESVPIRPFPRQEQPPQPSSPLLRLRAARRVEEILPVNLSTFPLESIEQDAIRTFSHLQTGLSIKIIRVNGQTRRETSQIVFINSNVPLSYYLEVSFQNNSPKLYINPTHFHYIDEILYVSKNGESVSDYSSNSEEKYKAVLKYGTKLVLDELVFTSRSREFIGLLRQEINNLKTFVMTSPYNLKLEMAFKHKFSLLEHSQYVSSSDFCAFVKSLTDCYTDSTIMSYACDEKKGFTIKEFNNSLYRFLNDEKFHSKIIAEIFSQNKDKFFGSMNEKAFQIFLANFQEEQECDCQRLVKHMNLFFASYRNLSQPCFKTSWMFVEFLDFLYSPHNSILNLRNLNSMTHDMDHPLSDYFINSSHNTYLTGNQLTSESNVDIYARLLRKGVRCVEIDCWDGNDGEPDVTHGKTLCTRIKFKDVIKCIASNAFADGNDFPVIISIENHCSTSQQKKMARIFQDEFGTFLLREAVGNIKPNRLPSPNQLKKKIILKGKKSSITKSIDSTASLASLKSEDEAYLSVLFGDSDEWKYCYLRLFGKFLECSWLEPDQTIENLPVNDQDVFCIGDGFSELEHPHPDPLFQYPLLLQLNRCQAETLIELHSDFKDGTYLLRKSSKGFKVLSVYQENIFYHTKVIESYDANGFVTYRVGDIEASLEGIVEFYHIHPFTISTYYENVEITLGKPVPESNYHRVMEWYIPQLKESTTFRLLSNDKRDGAFILWDDVKGEKQILSFVSGNLVCHVFLLQTESGIEVGGVLTVFPTITHLILYFEDKPFYDLTYLCHPYVTKNNFRQSQMFDTDENGMESRYLQGKELRLDHLTVVQAPKVRSQSRQRQIANNKMIDLSTSTITLASREKSPYVLKILHSDGVLNISMTNEQHLNDWRLKLQQSSGNFSEGSMKKVKVAKELSDLIVYCQATSYTSTIENNILKSVETPCEKMCSFSDLKAKTLMVKANRMSFLKYHHRQFSRIYPKPSAADSSNFNPIPFWCSGAQMVALNFQTPDDSNQINSGWFMQNASCGYILKPEYLRQDFIDPDIPVLTKDSFRLDVTVLSGRLLSTNLHRGVSTNPLVKVEVIGCKPDSSSKSTGPFKGSAFNPLWDHRLEFGEIHRPELAVLRFSVWSYASEMICQATVPLVAIRTGIRSIQMCNGFNEIENELSTLIVKIEKYPMEN